MNQRTISDKTLKVRAYEIARNCKYDGYQRALASIAYKTFECKTGVSVKEELAEQLHQPGVKKFKKGKVYPRFKDNILVADLAGMGSLSSKTKNVEYVLYVIDVFTKYARVKPWKKR